MARPLFDEELYRMKRDTSEMCELVKGAIAEAVEALRTGDGKKGYLVAQNDSYINEKERTIEALCVRMLLREQPVASDLREVTAALKIITDLERIGDQAGEIGEIVASLPDPKVASQFASLEKMATVTRGQVTAVIDAYLALDAAEALECSKGDADVNALFYEVKREIREHIVNHDEDESYSLDLLLIAKYLERIGDHVVNIAEWVEYAVTGVHKGQAMYEQ